MQTSSYNKFTVEYEHMGTHFQEQKSWYFLRTILQEQFATLLPKLLLCYFYYVATLATLQLLLRCYIATIPPTTPEATIAM